MRGEGGGGGGGGGGGEWGVPPFPMLRASYFATPLPSESLERGKFTTTDRYSTV